MSKLKSPGDSWRTPKQVFNTLNREFNFIADMASSKENALCETFFTEEHDSLSFDWKYTIECVMGHDLPNGAHYVFLNCPYSDPMPWVKKAIESQANGLGVVMLLNNDMSVGWFAEALKGASEIRCIIADPAPESKRGYSSGRLAFLNENGEPVSGNNKPQFVLVFNPFKIGENVTNYVRRSELYKA
jgi:phage N-6-adenine-methyltransferase